MNDKKQLMTAAEDYVHLLCVMPGTISIPLSQVAIRAFRQRYVQGVITRQMGLYVETAPSWCKEDAALACYNMLCPFKRLVNFP